MSQEIPDSSDERKSADRRFIASFLYNFGLYTGIGMQLAISVVGGLLGGKVVDEKLGTTPLFLLLGLTLGTVAGFYNLVRILNRQQQKKNTNDSAE